jgi:hypothetical protein
MTNQAVATGLLPTYPLLAVGHVAQRVAARTRLLHDTYLERSSPITSARACR